MAGKKTPEEILAEERQRQEAALNAAQQAAQGASSGATGTVSTQGADVVTKSGTRSDQTGTSSTTSLNTGTSVSNQQGHTESYAQEGVTPEQMAQRAAEYAKTHPGYTLNNKGEVVRDPNASLYDILQVDRDNLRDERERQERIQRLRKLEHGLANSAMLISDMVSAGIGGNVYKRDKDNTEEEANKEIARLHEAQLADDMAAKIQEKQEREKWSADLWKDLNEYRRDYLRRVSDNSSTGSQQSVQTGQQHTDSRHSAKSNTVQTTTYDDAQKGGGLRGYSRMGYGLGGGGKQGLTYWPIKIVNGPNGEEYMSFALAKEEKDALSQAIAATINTAADGGNTAAIELRNKYYKKLKKGDKSATWDYDALINDGTLYQVPGALNRYLDELTNMGISHEVYGANTPYTRRELYVMMTGDTQFANVPAGVNLGQNRLP